MASFILSRSLLVLLLSLTALLSSISISEATSSFSFTSSGKNASFESEDFALYGDAKLVDGGSSIQLTDSVSHGGGRVIYKKPIDSMKNIKFEYFTGFSTFFSFSISPNRGGRLGFVVFPVNETFDHSLFQVKFDTFDSFTQIGDSNVAVIVDGATVSERIRNFTIANLEKTEKVLLYAWINYQAGGKFLEVRLSKSKSFESVLPLMFDQIDLSQMLRDEDEFMVAVNSYSGNVNLHSWSLEVRHSEYEHSWAPVLLEEQLRKEEAAKKRTSDRMWEVVTCFVMTFGSTGLVFFAMMHIYAAFKRNNLAMVMQEECGIKTKEFGYKKMEKMEVVTSNADAKQERK
ncbi:Concanavalin A-like lectin/glucanase domain superfamily [Arabidopsis suecica]|uniref:Concanavalin A-like lectin/glucanase domain superfamily n=1 Tax=Arabidopsis suecica TaxID=45249 RepID=A0A8T2FHG0_ARASU|nr:Concanavalin A-like lectin/glucanase domain superfamily [Arabidopsis suecica]